MDRGAKVGEGIILGASEIPQSWNYKEAAVWQNREGDCSHCWRCCKTERRKYMQTRSSSFHPISCYSLPLAEPSQNWDVNETWKCNLQGVGPCNTKNGQRMGNGRSCKQVTCTRYYHTLRRQVYLKAVWQPTMCMDFSILGVHYESMTILWILKSKNTENILVLLLINVILKILFANGKQ